MRTTRLLSRALPALALAACGVAEAPPPVDDFGHDGTGIRFNMGALSYPDAADVCYSFTIVNGLDQLVVGRGLASTITDPTRNPDYAVWGANTPYVENAAYANGLPLVCSTQFGNGAGGDWSYVAPCDASANAATHTVTVWLDRFLAGDPPEALTEGPDYQDPCPAGCSVEVACTENADTPVSFNFTIMRAANQGFFDVGVNFDDVFCSAKLDTCHVDADDNVTPIGLLFDQTTGSRGHTAVAAVACSVGAGAGLDTTLWMTDFVVTCPDADGTAGGTYTLDLSTVTAEGNLTLTDTGTGNTLDVGVYFGDESLPDMNKVYTNVAFLLPDTGEPCFVNWTVIPTEGEEPPNPADDPPGTYTHVSAVIFDAPEGSDDPGAEVQYAHCHSHVLNGGAYTLELPLSAMNFYGTPIPSGVYTIYADEQAPAISSVIARSNPILGAPRRHPPYEQGDPDRNPPEGFSFIYLRPGTYTRGSPTSEIGRPSSSNAERQQEVTLTNPFFMQQTEVTVEQWASVIERWNALPDSERTMTGWSESTPEFGSAPSFNQACGLDCPVENVSWWDAVVFANALSVLEGYDPCYVLADCSAQTGTNTVGGGCSAGSSWCNDEFTCTSASMTSITCTGFRLPTEAEWEFAARAGDMRATYNGNLTSTGCTNPVLTPIAWFCDTSASASKKPVGGKLPNEWGLYDMIGNVAEWTWDWAALYSEEPETNPTGHPTGQHSGNAPGKNPRGGTFGGTSAQSHRAAARSNNGSPPHNRRSFIGFRLLRIHPEN